MDIGCRLTDNGIVVNKMTGYAVVTGTRTGSLAETLGLEAGDKIVSVNKNKVPDLIRFQYEWAGEDVLLEVEKKSGERELYEIDKDYDEPLGAEFSQAVFDGLKVCANRCVFCFVDQMPQEMRPSLYIKDDDYRLSFLQGSYITMTNFTGKDIERIKKEHLSPLYVSVHTTVPGLREKVLNHKAAGKVLAIMKDLAASGIEFHTQVVLCPGLNDGASLDRTYRDLAALKGVKSLAIVPVGLTRYRENLPAIKAVDQVLARQLIDWVSPKQQECRKNRGTSFVWLSDEFYLLAGREMPSYRAYEDFPQLENGVGMVRLLWEEFNRLQLPDRISPVREVVFVTGVSGKPAILPVIGKLNAVPGLRIDVKTAINTHFGPSVTVTGLLTGHCLLTALAGIKPHSTVFIPAVMLRMPEGRFLDDLTPADVAGRLKINLEVVPVKADQILERLLAIREQTKDGENI